MENSSLDVTVPAKESLATTLQNSVLKIAGAGHTNAGNTISQLMPLSRAANTWRTKETLWKKWLDFCNDERINPLSGNEGTLLLYLGWLFDNGSVSGSSVRQYLSAVTTAHVRIGVELSLTPLLQLAVTAYQQGDLNRKALEDPGILKERRALPSTVARRICNAALEAADTELKFIRAAAAILVSYVFFERGEAGSALLMDNISVTHSSLDIAVALRKGKSRVAHTLSYRRNPHYQQSVIDLVLKYDRLRRSTTSRSNYYWALPGSRHTPSARYITSWLNLCLKRVNIQPPPQVIWSSHSLRMGAASEAAALGIQEYRILKWGDWSSARTFRESYFDGRVQACDDSKFFFGHLE